MTHSFLGRHLCSPLNRRHSSFHPPQTFRTCHGAPPSRRVAPCLSLSRDFSGNASLRAHFCCCSVPNTRGVVFCSCTALSLPSRHVRHGPPPPSRLVAPALSCPGVICWECVWYSKVSRRTVPKTRACVIAYMVCSWRRMFMLCTILFLPNPRMCHSAPAPPVWLPFFAGIASFRARFPGRSAP